MKVQPNPLWLYCLFTYTVYCAIFFYIVFGSPDVFTDDGFYHYRVAALMHTQGLRVDISALPYTILGKHGVDHHWLWHLLIMPLTGLFTDDFLGLKVSIAMLGAIVPVSIFLFAKKLSLPSPWLVTALASFAIADLPGRYLLLCAQNVAVAFLLIYIIFFTRRNYLACGVVAWLFMLSYHGAVILLPLALMAALLSIYYRGKMDIQIIFATLGGLLLGLVINPWFPDTFAYIYFHFAHKVLTHTSMAVGREWHSITLMASLPMAWIAHSCLLGSLIAILFLTQETSLEKVIALETALLLAFSMLCLLLYLYASRFSEYYGPVAVLTAGLVFRDVGMHLPKSVKAVCLLALLALLTLKISPTVQALAEAGKIDGQKYAEASHYLAKHAQPGDMVFNLRWDDFVYLYWQNPQLHYVNGLDPNFLAQGSPEKYDIWAIYAVAKLPNVTSHAEYIKQNFAAKWIVVDFLYQPLIDKLMIDPHAQLVAGGDRSLLFKIRDD